MTFSQEVLITDTTTESSSRTDHDLEGERNPREVRVHAPLDVHRSRSRSIGADIELDPPSSTTNTAPTMMSLPNTLSFRTLILAELPVTMNTNENKRPRGGVKKYEGAAGVTKMKAPAPPMVDVVTIDSTATTNDTNLKQLEETTVAANMDVAPIPSSSTTLDRNGSSVAFDSAALATAVAAITDGVEEEEEDEDQALKKLKPSGDTKATMMPSSDDTTGTTRTAMTSRFFDSCETLPTITMDDVSTKPKCHDHPRKSFAPSRRAYLSQIPAQNGGMLTYLPRPEWCFRGMAGSLLMFVLNNDYDLKLARLKMSVSDILFHVNRYVSGRKPHTSKRILNLSSDDDDEDEDESDEDDITYSPKKMQYVKTQLKSNILYLDVNDYVWKTERLQNVDSTNTSGTTKVGSKLHTTPSLDDRQCRMTLDKLAQSYHRSQITGRFPNGHTILHMAIEEDATAVALDLIRMEYNSFRELVRRDNTLQASLGKMTMLETGHLGMTPLILAAQRGNVKIVEALLNCGVCIHGHASKSSCSIRPTAILQAAHFEQSKVIECIIDYYKLHNATRSVGPNAEFWPGSVEELICYPNEKETSPLMRAAQEGHVSIVKLLRKHKADPDEQNLAGMTALMFAAQLGYVEICRILIKGEADLNVQTVKKSTALLLACKRGHVAVVKELVSAGCELEYKNHQGRTAQQVMRLQYERSRRHLFDGQHLEDNDSGDEDIDDDALEGGRATTLPIESCVKISHMLDSHTQVEMMKFAARAKRNYEIIRIFNLLHRHPDDIHKPDIDSYTEPSVAVQWWRKMKTKTKDSDSDMATSRSFEQPDQDTVELRWSKLPRCKQLLARTMLLPAPLVQTIALFIPLPTVWNERLDQVFYFTIGDNPNQAVAHTLDMIDEMLDEGGFLSACDTAKVPAPLPHPTWMDWKRSANARTSWRSKDIEQWIPPKWENPLSATASWPPPPPDDHKPTICELRRLVCYPSLLYKYQSQGNIVTVLSEEPYNMPLSCINKLIQIADIASLCRRYNDQDGVDFKSTVAEEVFRLAIELYTWCLNRN